MPARVTPPRMAAFRILLALERSRTSHCDELLHGPAIDALAPADRNLTTALVMGVLRWQLALDALLLRYLKRKTRLDDEVAIALRMGAWQLLGMDRIPPHAALAESVELTKISGYTSASGMVNAVLRRVAERRSTTMLQPESAHPAWMMDRWLQHFGSQVAAAIAAYDQQEPEQAVRSNEATESLAPGAFLTRACRVSNSVIPEEAHIQDEGSQLVAEIAGQGSRILDCCAAPGGKTAILAENNPNAEITAVDISRARVDAMRRSFARDPQTNKIQCLLADATELPFRDDFDLILCDAPCSGTGTLARNPEIKLRLALEDLQRQQQRQIAILRSAYRVLAPGGRLVYSTCSLEPEENAAVIDAFLAEEPSAQLLDMRERLNAMLDEGALHPAGAELLREHALRGSYLQTLPGVLPCDGFFAAVLARR
jgi:16S rRNA (cytosine967-C5)-methyltransferase